jgi:hypothetical protein
VKLSQNAYGAGLEQAFPLSNQYATNKQSVQKNIQRDSMRISRSSIDLSKDQPNDNDMSLDKYLVKEHADMTARKQEEHVDSLPSMTAEA